MGEVQVQKRQKRTDGQREREGETVRFSWLAARARYLGSILLCGEEAILRLVQFFQHLVPCILRHMQLLFQLHNVIL